MTQRRIELGHVGRAVAANIQRLRRAQRLTYVELTAQLTAAGRPIPVLGLSRIERHERRVDVYDLVAFALVFGVWPVDLLDAGPECKACRGQPPAGFRCLICGTAG